MKNTFFQKFRILLHYFILWELEDSLKKLILIWLMFNLQKYIINMCKKAKIKKIIYASGLGVNASSSTGYFISKYRAEQLIINSGLDFSIFRPSYIVGKR